MKIRGILFYWLETGMEGNGAYSIQDERYIKPADAEHPYGNWSYDGLHPLKDGDYLRVFNPDGSVWWEGKLAMEKQGERLIPRFTDEHAELEFRRKFFGEDTVAELIRGKE